MMLPLAILYSLMMAHLMPIGIFDAHGDVGSVRHAGSASYNPRTQSYVIAGSGKNMWAERDDFHYVWKRLAGNFIISTRAHLVGRGDEVPEEVGWTIRSILDPDSP